jgi:hypothetical protein
MAADQFVTELEAQRSLLDLYEQAKKCQMLFERANIPIPALLRRVLFIEVTEDLSNASLAPHDRRFPLEAEGDWISIRQDEATPTCLVLAVLRDANGPLPAKDAIARVTEILPFILPRTIKNIVTRLNGKSIRTSKSGWELLKPESAGVLYKGFLWAPAAIFSNRELANHRREAILQLLSRCKTGLQSFQISAELARCPWVRAPVNWDAVKVDTRTLEKEGKIRREGSSKRWTLVPPTQKSTTAAGVK